MTFLVDLPVEVLDLIISQTISWPAQTSYYLGSPNRIDELFNSPIFRICRLLRGRSFRVLNSMRVWIRVIALTEAACESLRQLAYDLPVPGPLWSVPLDRNVDPHVILEISDEPAPQDLKDGDDTNDGQEDEAVAVADDLSSQHGQEEASSEDNVKRQVCHQPNIKSGENNEDDGTEGTEGTADKSSIMFPYDYESFLRFCVTAVTIKPSIQYFIGLARRTSIVLQRVLDVELAHIISRTSDLFSLKMSAERRNNGSDQASLDIRQRRSFLYMACTIITMAQDIKDAGETNRSDLLLLYFGIPLRRLGAFYLTDIHQWISDVIGSQEGGPGVHEKVAVRNVSLGVLHYLECETCEIFVKLCKSRGHTWFLGNYTILSDKGERWLEEPSWHWFGLSDNEMARLHLARAILLWYTGSMMPPYQLHSENRTLLTTDDQIKAMHNMYITVCLDPDVCRFAPDLLKHTTHYILEWPALILPDFTVATFSDTSGRWHEWVGTKNMFRGWGSFETLTWLPLVQWARQNFDRVC